MYKSIFMKLNVNYNNFILIKFYNIIIFIIILFYLRSIQFFVQKLITEAPMSSRYFTKM